VTAVPFDPLRAVGMVLRQHEPDGAHTFLGSCFCVRDSTAALTAAHCLGELSSERLTVQFPRGLGGDRYVAVSQVIRHSRADAALLRLALDEWEIEPFQGIGHNRGLGSDVVAYGFPENVLSAGREPTERLFRGHIQRQFWHESFLGFAYDALELSFACPAGLSGGPIFDARLAPGVVGVATENFESTTFIDAFEDTTRGGDTTRKELHKIVSYGVAVDGAHLVPWIDDHLSGFDHAAYARRQQ
jgi:hypothetical protein